MKAVQNDYFMQVVGKRIEFWRDQLQAAFRNGDAHRAAECTRFLEEYSTLTTRAEQETCANASEFGTTGTKHTQAKKQITPCEGHNEVPPLEP